AQPPDTALPVSQPGRPRPLQRPTATGSAAQDHIGRTAPAAAIGAKQNHNFVYAIVEHAKVFQEGQAAQPDAPDVGQPGVSNTVLNGVYVSKNWGRIWVQLGDTNSIAENPNTGSALAGAGQATLYAP